MQLFALDGKNLIYVEEAQKNAIYRCIECKAAVKARKGPCRHKHFYHLKAQFNCRSAQKTENHIFIQLLLKNNLPGCVALERHFPIINRIADVVWEDRKIIFEVQCSPISEKEAILRSKDYAAQGYQLVWILHDRLFGKKKPSAAERFLRLSPCYYTNIAPGAGGIFYDRLEVIDDGWRKIFSRKLAINITSPFRMVSAFTRKALPQQLNHRLKHHQIYFKGDALSRCLKGDSLKFAILKMAQIVRKPKPAVPGAWQKTYYWLEEQLERLRILYLTKD